MIPEKDIADLLLRCSEYTINNVWIQALKIQYVCIMLCIILLIFSLICLQQFCFEILFVQLNIIHWLSYTCKWFTVIADDIIFYQI